MTEPTPEQLAAVYGLLAEMDPQGGWWAAGVCKGRGTKYPDASPYAVGNGVCCHGKVKPHDIPPPPWTAEMMERALVAVAKDTDALAFDAHEPELWSAQVGMWSCRMDAWMDIERDPLPRNAVFKALLTLATAKKEKAE